MSKWNAEQYGEKVEHYASTCDETEDMATSIDMEYNLEVDLFEIEPLLQQRLSSAQASHESDDDIISE